MPTKAIATDFMHKMPIDLKKALHSDESVYERWENLTPLARNEWICWNITNKKPETRKNHIERTVMELLEGKRRPCCWIGCIHRWNKMHKIKSAVR